ncbi:uncharacterized protein LOC126834550 isoform X2 [Adelges cooleyi]|uniref:uncharacterized protein LOC126834550 isoform X2 n=1 Tax=Adelges cooleyi TaxID=133065 RepID=UPI00217FB2FE|nr:uncharacterized protein LOC126834550 isoform X2 [Adelges cooleyi]
MPKNKAIGETRATDEQLQPEWSSMKFATKCKYVLRHITVEPLVMIYILANVAAQLINQNLNMEKACSVNLHYSNETCSALKTNSNTTKYAAEEVVVQQLVANMLIWQTVVQNGIPMLFVIFLGSWSDRHQRRKPLILMPVIGELCSNIGILFSVYYFYQLPMEVAGIAESVPASLGGGWMIMFMAVFSYMGDVTSEKMRTVQIGILHSLTTLSIAVGSYLPGATFQTFGFFSIYSTCGVLLALSLLYGLIFIKDKAPKSKFIEGKTTVLSQVADFFDTKHIVGAFETTFKSGKDNKRFKIIALMGVIFTVVGPTQGERSVLYLFTRVRFGWTESQYSVFSSYSIIMNALGTLLAIGLLGHKFGISDPMLGLISCAGKILARLIYMFTTSDAIFYLGPVVDMMNTMCFIVMRSLITKLVASDELVSCRPSIIFFRHL